jgi:energy-coupling factor transport system ATP-binding protein
MTLLRVQGLSARYLTRRAQALDDVSFSIEAGERVLLAGPSGSGKSTLGLCLSGLIPLSLDADLRGQVEVDGRPTLAYAPGDLAERVGTVFQDPSSQFTMLTVEDEVAFGLENLGLARSEMPERVHAALDAVSLVDRAQWRIDRLSGGLQQRVALAAALAMRPQALVLDEPTAHLDPRSATALYDTLDALADARGTTLVTIEHDLDHVASRFERGLLLDRQGRLVADASLAEAFGERIAVDAWAALGVRLPAATALARALSTELDLPSTIEHGADWVAARPWAQQALRAAALASRTTEPGDVVVDARGLRLRYTSPASAHLALNDVDLQVREGELVAIVGANGSGKSTLLRVLTGLLRPEQGQVTVGGVDLRAAPARQVARLVAHVFQNPEAGFVADTVEDELAYGPRALRWSAAEIAEHTRSLLERFGLASLRRANPFSLSEGQKRRLSVATSLVLGPRALLLDEPTFGQDRQSAHALMDEIAQLCTRGLAVVIATHDLELVTEIADRVVALADGQVVFDGPPLALLADGDLLARVGQEPPPLVQLLGAARARGALVPPALNWRAVETACPLEVAV